MIVHHQGKSSLSYIQSLTEQRLAKKKKTHWKSTIIAIANSQAAEGRRCLEYFAELQSLIRMVKSLFIYRLVEKLSQR
jgi:hypothetical protein